MPAEAFIDRVRGRLIVSCQPVVGGPLDDRSIIVAFARAALDGGAAGLRIEGAANIAAVRAATDAPIVGLIKCDRADSPVRITGTVGEVQAVIAAGADAVAFDATVRRRPAPVPDLCAAAHDGGALAFADCADIDDGHAALDAGCDIVGTTLSGHVGGLEPDGPDLALIGALRRLTANVVAEGHIRRTQDASAAIAAGAAAVVVGSAITRPEYVTRWFCDAIAEALAARTLDPVSAS